MTISVRSIKTLMEKALPGRKVSYKAAQLLKLYLEGKAEELAVHASRVHDRENAMRTEIGDREKVFLSKQHMKMAIDGKFSRMPEVGRADSEP
ncbi:MAG TPA: hypothetical protein VGB78_02755 [Thermoplasmata archaeon]|jgi:hypothetical protein